MQRFAERDPFSREIYISMRLDTRLYLVPFSARIQQCSRQTELQRHSASSSDYGYERRFRPCRRYDWLTAYGRYANAVVFLLDGGATVLTEFAKERAQARQTRKFAPDNLMIAAGFLFLPPLLLFALGWTGLWILRGFRS